MAYLLLLVGIVICIWQLSMARKGKVKTSLVIAILFSVIAVLMILFGVTFIKIYQTVIAIILWILFGLALTKRSSTN
jgi:purine-cytosine permease-like protein